MPWKERSIVEERMRFVLRLKDGLSMASLCREFGISRVTGYLLHERYKECGLEGLTDRARTPYRYAHKLPAQLEAMIVSMRRVKPTWGARKLRERLFRKLPNDVRVPACSTIHAIMDRHRLVTRQKRSRSKTEATPLSQGLAPHALWCTDYKGEFLLGDKRYCYPLTVSDYASRYLLLCEARESVSAPTTACPLKLAVHPDLKMRRQAGQEFFGFRIHLYDKMVR
jgi:transposase